VSNQATGLAEARGMSTKVIDAGSYFIGGMSAGAILADCSGIRVALWANIALGIINLGLYMRASRSRHE